MSFCFLYNVVSENHSVQNSPWGGGGGEGGLLPAQGLCYLVFKVHVVAKLTYLVAIIGGHVTAKLPHILRFMTKQNSIWSKVWSYKKKNYFSENQLVLPRNYFQNRILR